MGEYNRLTMAISFNAQFRVSESTQSRVLRLTDDSSGFTFGKSRFVVSFPDSSTRGDLASTNYDIFTQGGYIDIPAVTDVKGNLLVGNYVITYFVLNSANAEQGQIRREFTFDWIRPDNGIVNESDSMIPEVKFSDSTNYASSGNFTHTITRAFSTQAPTTSEAMGQSASSTTNSLTASFSNKYYEGVYNVSNIVNINYTNSTYSWLTVFFTQNFQTTFAIKKAPSQYEIVQKIIQYRQYIDDLKEKNDNRFNILSEQYDLVMALYTDLIARFEVGLSDNSQDILEELLAILNPYNTGYTYQATQMLPFTLGINVNISFNAGNGVASTLINSGETLNLLSSSPALTISVSSKTITFNPIFGTTSGTFVQGNDSRFHSAVTIGTANGLSLASQALSLALATSVSAGALSGDDKAKIDSFSASNIINWNTAYEWGNHAIAGYLTSINDAQIISALGFTPYSATNPSGFLTNINFSQVVSALGFTPYDSSNPNGYIDAIDSVDVINALGFTPYNITNPNNFINGIDYQMVIAALGYVPYSNNNPNGYISLLTDSGIINALGFTPVNPNRTLTINGVSYDLSEDRTWEVAVASELNLDTSEYGDDISYDIATSTLRIAKYDWMDLVRGYSVRPTLFATIATGKVYEYIYDTDTFYRFVATDKSLDAFYTESTLTTELCRKKIII